MNHLSKYYMFTKDVKNIESGLCLYRNIFGPVLGSSPAQNAPVLPTLQQLALEVVIMNTPNVMHTECNENIYSFSSKTHFVTSSSHPIHKSLCCCSCCPGDGHQPFPDQWQSSQLQVCVWVSVCVLHYLVVDASFSSLPTFPSIIYVGLFNLDAWCWFLRVA